MPNFGLYLTGQTYHLVTGTLHIDVFCQVHATDVAAANDKLCQLCKWFIDKGFDVAPSPHASCYGFDGIDDVDNTM